MILKTNELHKLKNIVAFDKVDEDQLKLIEEKGLKLY